MLLRLLGFYTLSGFSTSWEFSMFLESLLLSASLSIHRLLSARALLDPAVFRQVSLGPTTCCPARLLVGLRRWEPILEQEWLLACKVLYVVSGSPNLVDTVYRFPPQRMTVR